VAPSRRSLAAKDAKAIADAMILIWLPGGVAQTDTWDPKSTHRSHAGMKGSELLGTCPERSYPSADGILFGEGLGNQSAAMMNKGTVVRSLMSETKFGAVHLKAQYYAKTGYLFPRRESAEHGIGRRADAGTRSIDGPPFIDIGRDINTSHPEFQFINEYSGPGFYGPRYAPFMIPEPAQGLPTLNAVAGMKMDRLDRRQAYLQAINAHERGGAAQERQGQRVHVKTMEDARAMMDSPVKKAFRLHEGREARDAQGLRRRPPLRAWMLCWRGALIEIGRAVRRG
jgi:hypothetical protein